MAAERERRKQPRFSIAGPIVVASESDEHVEGDMADVSVLGFRFYSARALDLGERVSATIQFPSGTSYVAEGVIRHATDAPPYCYGVAFTEETMARIIKESFGSTADDSGKERS